MTQQFLLTLKARSRGMHLVTGEVMNVLSKLPESGVLHVFIQHTSAGLTINENADLTVRNDLKRALDRLAPENEEDYEHDSEGPDDMPAHIKSVLVGSSISIPISQGKLNLGTWQGIYLCEFRNQGGPRKLVLTILS